MRATLVAVMVALLVAGGLGCAPDPEATTATSGAVATAAFEASEAAFDATYAATPIDLGGRVVDENGAPVPGAEVTTIAWGDVAAQAGRLAAADGDGRFALPALARRSLLLRVAHPGHFAEIVAIDLERPRAPTDVDAGAIVLTAHRPGRARLVFAGDTMFGRRFVDGGLIRPGARAADATALLRFLADALAASDFTQVNLESTVTDDPATPHPYKSFVFYSHPETLAALPAAGVDAVTLGNNHVYDYLEAGLADTLAGASASGLAWFGAGTNETRARASRLHVTVGDGVQVAFQGFDQIVNDGTTLARYRLVARDAPGAKAGALELSRANALDFVSGEPSDRLVVPVLHGGVEYSDYPSAAMRARLLDVVQAGADLVVAHHPHTSQGVGVLAGPDGPVLAFLSMGNLLFDQEVFETFQSYLAVVDVDGTHVHRVQLLPFHAEGYVPKLVTGAAIGRAGRRVGHLSTTLPGGDGLAGATVFPAGTRIVVAADAAGYATQERVQEVALADAAPFELERAAEADMLAGVGGAGGAAGCEVGRDILLYGGFEDEDADDAFHEAAMWDQTASHHVENSVVHRGTGAAVLLRSASHTSTSLLFMNNRVRFDPAHPLSLVGHVRGERAGAFTAEVTWFDDDGTRLANQVVHTRAAGSYGWERFAVALTPPPGATSLRPAFRAAPPASGEAATFVDDVAVVEWEAEAQPVLPTPNDWSFVRCRGADAPGAPGAPGAPLLLELTFRSYLPVTHD